MLKASLYRSIKFHVTNFRVHLFMMLTRYFNLFFFLFMAKEPNRSLSLPYANISAIPRKEEKTCSHAKTSILNFAQLGAVCLEVEVSLLRAFGTKLGWIYVMQLAGVTLRQLHWVASRILVRNACSVYTPSKHMKLVVKRFAEHAT